MSGPLAQSLVACVLCVSPPVADTGPEPTPSAQPDAPTPPSAPSEIERYLQSSGMELLKLREALEAQPETTAQACQQWWTGSRANATQAQREQVLALWGQVDPKASAKALSQALQSHWRGMKTDAYVDCERNEHHHERLCSALIALGPSAAPELLHLSADGTLPVPARAVALQALALHAPAQWLPDLAKKGLSDPSDPMLREALERALLSRARRDKPAKNTLIRDLEQALTHHPLSPVLALRLWTLIEKLSGNLDPKLYRTLARALRDPQVSVPQRVVYGRILAQAPSAQSILDASLNRLYGRIQGPNADSVVLAQTLLELSPSRRSQFLETHPTWLSTDPQLAELSWRDAPLPPSPKLKGALLRTGLHSIWPQVQSAALARLQGPCNARNERKAARLAGPQSKGGSPERSVRREAIDALARCNTRFGRRKLKALADNEAVGAYDRGRALRRYIEQSPRNESTAKRVRTIVRRAPNELGRSALFLGLGQLENAPAYVIEELCLWSKSQQPLVAKTSAKNARAALQSLGRLGDCE